MERFRVQDLFWFELFCHFCPVLTLGNHVTSLIPILLYGKVFAIGSGSVFTQNIFLGHELNICFSQVWQFAALLQRKG